MLRAGLKVHLRALRVQEQALCAKMGSESYFELLHSRVKSAQAPTISGPNIDRIQTKQAGYFRNSVLQLCSYKKLSGAHEDIVQTLLFTRSVFAVHSKLLCALQQA